MKNAGCAETNEKSIIDFYFLRYGCFYTQNWSISTNFEYKFDRNSKIKNRKIDFSFVSEHCVSSIKMAPFLRGGGLYILSWEKP